MGAVFNSTNSDLLSQVYHATTGKTILYMSEQSKRQDTTISVIPCLFLFLLTVPSSPFSEPPVNKKRTRTLSHRESDSSTNCMVEPARRYSNPEDHRAAGLCHPQNCRIKQKGPGGCRGSLSLSCICWQHHHATPRIFSTLFKTSSGSRPEPFTLPAISCASTSAGSGSAGFAATPWMVQ